MSMKKVFILNNQGYLYYYSEVILLIIRKGFTIWDLKLIFTL